MQSTIFDYLEAEEQAQFLPKDSTDYSWSFKDYPKEKNGLKVFSCFACGGGSTMGYKLAGCEVLGCNEIDPEMNEVYINNHKPKYNFLMDIREFNKLEDLPEELYNLDILDGSPPCTTFSMAGLREETWGKEKKFREGQTEQVLDELSFVFIETAKKLRPKVVIMENVAGLLAGAAWEYVQRIYSDFKEAGYKVHHWLLKGENMGVPQKRHRVFFIAIRNDLGIDPKELNMVFNYKPVLYGEVKTKEGKSVNKNIKAYKLLEKALPTDKDLSDVMEREEGKSAFFTYALIHDNEVCPTIIAHVNIYRYPELTEISDEDIRTCSTFPTDYNFMGKDVGYICGMSVPPLMIKRIVARLLEEGVFYKGG